MKFFLFFLFCYFTFNTLAQNDDTSNNRWLFKFGGNLVNNYGGSNSIDGHEIQKFAFSRQLAAGVEYRFSKRVSVGYLLSLNKFKALYADLSGSLISEDINYAASDFNLKYYLWDVGTNNNFNTYFSGGIGAFGIENNNSISLNFGGGLIVWLNNSLGINLESFAKWSLNNDANYVTNHFQHFVGFTYRFNNKNRLVGDVVDSGVIYPLESDLKKNIDCPDGDSTLDKVDSYTIVKDFNATEEIEIESERNSINNQKTSKTLKGYSRSVYFDPGTYSFEYDSFASLRLIVVHLKQFHNADIIVEGYTDNIDRYINNEKLSKERADRVKDFLILNGIPSKKIKVIGLGESQPQSSNLKEERRSQNNRVIIKIL